MWIVTGFVLALGTTMVLIVTQERIRKRGR